MLLAIIDPEGVARRKARRMKRRVYQNKVRIPGLFVGLPRSASLGEFCFTQGPDLCGILMAMIS